MTQLPLFYEPTPVDELRPGDVVFTWLNSDGHRGPVLLGDEIENPHSPEHWRTFIADDRRVTFSRNDRNGPHHELARRAT